MTRRDLYRDQCGENGSDKFTNKLRFFSSSLCNRSEKKCVPGIFSSSHPLLHRTAIAHISVILIGTPRIILYIVSVKYSTTVRI